MTSLRCLSNNYQVYTTGSSKVLQFSTVYLSSFLLHRHDFVNQRNMPALGEIWPYKIRLSTQKATHTSSLILIITCHSTFENNAFFQ